MSFQAMAWAVEQKCKCPGQKLALLMLANHSNGHTGQCNPSHKRLADECSMGVSTLKAHLRDLQQAGYLTIIHKSHEGVSMPNQYRLNLDRVGQILTGGGSNPAGGVGQILATNQEVEPGIEPTPTNTGVLVGISGADAPLLGRRKNDCPHKEIIALYHEILPMCPQVKDWTPTRAIQLRARWNEDEKRQTLAYWKRFFEYVRTCDFLVGRGSKPFFADLEWITKSANFTKIREAKYENRGQA